MAAVGRHIGRTLGQQLEGCSSGSTQVFRKGGSIIAGRSFSSTSRRMLATTSLDEMITGTAPVSSPSSSVVLPPAPTPASKASLPFHLSRPNRSSSSVPATSTTRMGELPSAPYVLHAHCMKHNTILTLTRGSHTLLDDMNVQQTYDTLSAGRGEEHRQAVDPAVYGQTVAKASCGTVGFKKGQRSSFEAATRTANKMFELIRSLG